MASGGRETVDDSLGREDQNNTDEDDQKQRPIKAPGEHHVAGADESEDRDQPADGAGQRIDNRTEHILEWIEVLRQRGLGDEREDGQQEKQPFSVEEGEAGPSPFAERDHMRSLPMVAK